MLKREWGRRQKERGEGVTNQRESSLCRQQKKFKKREREGSGCFFNTTQKKENIIPLTSNLASWSVNLPSNCAQGLYSAVFPGYKGQIINILFCILSLPSRICTTKIANFWKAPGLMVTQTEETVGWLLSDTCRADNAMLGHLFPPLFPYPENSWLHTEYHKKRVISWIYKTIFFGISWDFHQIRSWNVGYIKHIRPLLIPENEP